MNEEYKLKACPFCGDTHPRLYARNTDWTVRCRFCYASVPSCQSPEQAASAWNMRPETPDPDPDKMAAEMLRAWTRKIMREIAVSEVRNAIENLTRGRGAIMSNVKLTLKPCRFCGGEAQLFQVEIKDRPGQFWSVRCVSRLECYRLSKCFPAPELAAAAWNEKAVAPELDMKPCPFCGDKAVLRNALHRHKEGLEWHISCNDVGCCYLCNYWDTPEEAVAAWNRRCSNA